MDRLCSRIVLLLLTGALISSKNPEELNVYLEPKYIKVCLGDSVTINCTFQPSGKYKLRWYYSPTDSDCNSGTEGLHEKRRIYTENNDTWSVFTINSIKTNESGWYFCKVTRDIPVLDQKCSNGIQVLVDANSTQEYPKQPQMQNPTQNLTTQDSPTTCLISATTIPSTSSRPPTSFTQWWIWLASAVGCAVLLVSVVVICILTRKPEEIIYENTKPMESSYWRRNRTKMDICDLPSSKKTDTIKPLRKYDTLSSNRIRRP
ncbi:uncharacterized protein LOC107741536 [Sinocyclocheilus rhinocerous]|uniref:uncharacterized protein LOC107741536 n=1 Tax=Sinocyclocheilus rhinocerous TaxID=307959 RepID=UPI0007B950F5|nr:PREDICTED: uncharacterized protein LOC107741536 [Sinocyclocheilus rhinocerous]